MKRFAALALVGSLPLVALAGPVSVYPSPKPPAAQLLPVNTAPGPSQGTTPAAPPTSLNQPLSAAVQTAASNLPQAPAPVMTSSPSWGSPAVYPGTTVPGPSGAAPCGTAPCAAPCGDSATTQPVRPYLNLLAPRGGCDDARGSCLDKLKDWLCYRSSPGGPPCTPVPYRAPTRAYFPCRPTDGCISGGCGAGGPCAGGVGGNCATGNCGTGIAATGRLRSLIGGGMPGGGNCGTTPIPVSRLSASDCSAPTCRPRVLFIPLNRAECPTTGCDSRPVRPRLFDRLLGLFNCGPRCGTGCDGTTGDGVWCSPNDWKGQAVSPPAGQPMQPMQLVPLGTVNPPMTPPAPPTGTKPISAPQSGWNGKTAQLPSQQPFTNP